MKYKLIISTIILSMSLLAGCGGDSGNTTGPETEPTTGTLEVTVATGGPDPDEDGYTVTVDARDGKPSDANDTIYFTNLGENAHEVELSEMADNCVIQGDNPKSFGITAGDTTSISYQVNCSEVLENQIVFSRSHDQNIELYVMNTDGTQQTRLTNTPGIEEVFASISPDAMSIAYSTSANFDGNIATINADGTGFKQLTFSGEDAYPRWSPDGEKITFISNRDGNLEIYVMNADGSGQTRLTNNSADDSYPEWSPNGSMIYFTSNRDGDPEIFSMDTSGLNITQITKDSSDNLLPVSSSDGSKLAFLSDRDGDLNLYIMNTDGSDVHQLTAFNAVTRFPSWSPDGSRIAFDTNKDGNDFQVYSIGADGTGLINLSANTFSDGIADWSPLE